MSHDVAEIAEERQDLRICGVEAAATWAPLGSGCSSLRRSFTPGCPERGEHRPIGPIRLIRPIPSIPRARRLTRCQ